MEDENLPSREIESSNSTLTWSTKGFKMHHSKQYRKHYSTWKR